MKKFCFGLLAGILVGVLIVTIYFVNVRVSPNEESRCRTCEAIATLSALEILEPVNLLFTFYAQNYLRFAEDVERIGYYAIVDVTQPDPNRSEYEIRLERQEIMDNRYAEIGISWTGIGEYETILLSWSDLWIWNNFNGYYTVNSVQPLYSLANESGFLGLVEILRKDGQIIGIIERSR